MVDDLLIAAHSVVESGEYAEALPLIEEILEESPNHSGALNMAGFCWLELGKDATSLQFFLRALQTEPENKYVLLNVGRALHELGRYEQAIQYYLKAAEIDPSYSMAYANAAASLVQLSAWEDGLKASELALETDPENETARMNIANCLIALGRFKEGWESYELSLGRKFRKEWVYGDEPRWDGSKDQVLVVYGEQELGDEIYFAQAMESAIFKSKKTYIDCDPRLEGLFKRSFPGAEVHGNRRDSNITWGEDITARCAMGSLLMHCRPEASYFSRKPYLVPCPDRSKMWRALFDSWGKKVIGICSTGGTKKNNKVGRTINSDDFLPLREKYPDAVFISLDYKGEDPEWCNSYHFATRSNDYDDTAALISQCDAVVGICTTAMHCADALGVPSITLVPDQHNWKFSGAIPYLENAKVIHQNKRDWKEVIKEINLDF